MRIVLVGLAAGVTIGFLVATGSAAASPHKHPACAHEKAGAHKRAACPGKRAAAKPHKKAAARLLRNATVGAGGVSLDSWMGDLAPQLRSRKLSEIVIPGSHDTTTYSVDHPLAFLAYAQTQDKDLTDQLNGGIRQFDVRVEYTADEDVCNDKTHCVWDYYAHHGSGFLDVSSSYLTLSSILDSIDQWAVAPGHEHEIILLNLTIDQKGHDFPTQACQNFGAALGGSLVTPNELQSNFGTSDPGQVTLGQLWSLSDPKGAARVIMKNDQCMDAADPSAGQWSTFSSGYYADQCTADGDSNLGTLGNQSYGTEKMDLAAARYRATEAGPGEPYLLGPTAVGGLYELDIQGTPEQDCLLTPSSMLSGEQQVLAALYSQWQTDPATQRNLNIVEGDFVEDTDLVTDAIAMDERLPGVPDAVTRLGAERVVIPEGYGGFVGPSAFAALASYQGQGTPGAPVWYTVSPATGVGFGTPGEGGSATIKVAADGQGDVNPGEYLNLIDAPGTWTVTASLGDSPSTASWTVVVVPASGLHLKAVACDSYPACNSPTVQVNQTYDADQDPLPAESFTVAAVDKNGVPLTGVPVTFDAGSAGAFAGASNSVTVNSENHLFNKRAAAPAFTAGIRAGTFPISVSSPEADNTLTLPVTITPDAPTSFVVTKGDGQATPISTKFPIALQGHWVDQYGNVVTDPPPADRVLTLSPSDGTWPNGSNSNVTVTPGADGTITAPDLTAGRGVLAGPDAAHSLIVKVGGASAWTLQVMPGPPAKLTAVGGDGQHTVAGKPFAQALAAEVVDASDNPIPGYPVTFKVTSGEAAFAPVNLRLAALVTGKPALLRRADPPRDTVTVMTGGQGVATAPVLTAGPNAGPIEITASAGVAPAVKQALFSLSVDKVAPSAPTIDGLSDGDAQVGVAFSGASDGSAPITSYTVRATDQNHPTAPPVTASGSSSPITVKGLTNGDPYAFTVTATSADGTSPPSTPSGVINVGVAPTIVTGPANGTVGKSYSSGFTVTGAPAPTVTLVSGNVPGLTPGSDGSLTGTPTQTGNYELTVQATNPVGIYSASVTVAIRSATLAAPPPASGARRVHATICATRAAHKPACAVRTLTGTFPPLQASAAATLARGNVTYAIGRAGADYRELTLTPRHQIAAGNYTLILRRPRRAIFVPVVLR